MCGRYVSPDDADGLRANRNPGREGLSIITTFPRNSNLSLVTVIRLANTRVYRKLDVFPLYYSSNSLHY
jgi:hypothetical protein